MKETYENNKNNFSLLFQSISNENKIKIFKLFKNFQDYNVLNNYISPHLNDTKNFINTFQLKLNKNVLKNIDYIRYSLDENNGDTFYRCFIFNLFEKKILNKDKEYIYMIIFDIFKIYDLAPDTFNTGNNINNNTYLNQYKKILIYFNEPTKIIFQLITIIFGVNLEIIYIIIFITKNIRS